MGQVKGTKYRDGSKAQHKGPAHSGILTLMYLLVLVRSPQATRRFSRIKAALNNGTARRLKATGSLIGTAQIHLC